MLWQYALLLIFTQSAQQVRLSDPMLKPIIEHIETTLQAGM